jgi:hypothetical protein
MISVLLPTYARPEFLAEAIECFLRQTYTNSELVVLNDWRGHTVHFDHPRVRVFNNDSPERKSLGAVRNWLCDRAKGDIVCDWDDDDLYLPDHLERVVAIMPLYRSGKIAKQRWQWKWTVGDRLFRITPAGYMHTILMRRELRLSLGGYANQSRHSDAEFLSRLLKGGHLIGPQASHYQPTFIQRLKTGREHLSWGPSPLESDADRHARIDKEAEALGITGKVHIQPKWNADYVQMSNDSYSAVLRTGWGK